MNIFEAIKKDHEKQRELMSQLVETHGDTAKRDRIFEHVKLLLQAHEDAEERSLFTHLINQDRAQDKARHSIAEHKEIDDMIKYLEETDYSSAGWLVMAKKLKDKVEHHLDEEENEVFAQAGKVLSDDQKESLAVDYEKEMKTAMMNHQIEA